MKRFIFSILCVAVFFIGLGALVEKTGAKFKSDERALALIAKSRQAIGGDTAISSVRFEFRTGLFDQRSQADKKYGNAQN